MPIIESYGYAVDTERLPAASLINLVKKGMSQTFGNGVSAAAATASVKANGEFDREKWIKEERDRIYQKLMDGTVGERVYAPRVDPVDRKFTELVEKTAKAGLKVAGYKWPKDEESVVTFGNGVTRTRAQLRATVEKNSGDKLYRDAERLVAQEAKSTRATRAADAGAFDPDALGAS